MSVSLGLVFPTHTAVFGCGREAGVKSTTMSAVAFHLHLAASVLMVTTGLSMGSICAMSEGMHQIIDAAAHVASINRLLAAVWGRVATSPEEAASIWYCTVGCARCTHHDRIRDRWRTIHCS